MFFLMLLNNNHFEWLYCLGSTPLLYAAYSGKIETVKLLISKRSSVEEKNDHGES